MEDGLVQRVRANLCAWVIEALVWLTAALDGVPRAWRRHPIVRAAITEGNARIARGMRLCVHVLRLLIILTGCQRFRPAHTRMRASRLPPNVAPGFRAMRVSRSVRRATSGIVRGMHEGSLKQRATRLRRAFETFETFVARFLARFAELWRCPRQRALVVCAPQRDALGSTPHAAPACADSS
jgi:hypothetical protein